MCLAQDGQSHTQDGGCVNAVVAGGGTGSGSGSGSGCIVLPVLLMMKQWLVHRTARTLHREERGGMGQGLGLIRVYGLGSRVWGGCRTCT